MPRDARRCSRCRWPRCAPIAISRRPPGCLAARSEELAAEVGRARIGARTRHGCGVAPRRAVLGRASGGARAGPRRRVATGLTDLDRVEVIEGLAEGDQVALLPSSGLTEIAGPDEGIHAAAWRNSGHHAAVRRSHGAGAVPLSRGGTDGQRMSEILRVALGSIAANPFRAVLTMLGVVIGVGSVITMLALGRGAQRAVDEQLAALGANVITVTTGMRFAQGVARDQQVLTIDDAAGARGPRRDTPRRGARAVEPAAGQARQPQSQPERDRHDTAACARSTATTSQAGRLLADRRRPRTTQGRRDRRRGGAAAPAGRRRSGRRARS